MTFEFDASQSGARPVYCVSIETRRCGLNYGESPCAAAIGVTGSQQCFNTLSTCQDLQNISLQGSWFYRFIEPIYPVPNIVNEITTGFGPFPFLAGPPSFSPSSVDPSGGFGVRASVSIQFADSTHHDTQIDPYVESREYDPIQTGTFFGKWLARNPFYIGQRVLVELGHLDDDGTLNLSNAQRLWYFVESIDGPDSQGRVTVKAKDVLKLAENVRAQCPEPSGGTLLAELGENESTFFVKPPEALDDYPSSGSIFKVRIGNEIIRCKREGDEFRSVLEDGTPATLGRAIDNTEESSHKADSTVQLVKEFTAQTVPTILQELLTEFATINNSFIDLAQWVETQGDIGFLFSAQISEPEGVQDLCEQLLKSSGSFIYYDERTQQLKLGSIIETPPIDTLPVLSDDSNFIQDSVRITRKDNMRLSQVWYFRGLINSTEDLEDPVNYENRLVSIDPEAETQNLYGQKKIEKTWARWTPGENAAAAFAVGGRRLNRFRRTPREVTFQLDTKDSETWTNAIVAINHRNLQGPTGAPELTPFQVLSVAHMGHSKLTYTALEYDVDPVGDFGEPDTVIIDQDATLVNVLEVYENTIGPAEEAGGVVTVIVLNAVNVRGLVGGGFPSSSIRLINRGNVAGISGGGGQGGAAFSETEAQTASPGSAGSDGGDAINMDEDWEIFNFGNIYGGAGGGGGGGGAVDTSSPFNAASGGGGGSGQDLLVEVGGLGGSVIADGTASEGAAGGNGTSAGGGTGGAGGSAAGVSGGNGGNGGAFAEAGTSGGFATGDLVGAIGAGGAAGLAIKQNGYNLSVTEEGNIVGTIEP